MQICMLLEENSALEFSRKMRIKSRKGIIRLIFALLKIIMNY